MQTSRLRQSLILAVLLVPLSAAADPITTVAALAPYIGGTAAALAGSVVSFIAANAVSIAFVFELRNPSTWANCSLLHRAGLADGPSGQDQYLKRRGLAL